MLWGNPSSKSRGKGGFQAINCWALSSALEKGDSISLIGFGSFKVVERAAREGRNTSTGEKRRSRLQRQLNLLQEQILKCVLTNKDRGELVDDLVDVLSRNRFW